MSMEDTHIASAFDRDLQDIQARIMKMGGLVEAAITESAEALRTRDVALAEEVRKRDKQIDAMTHDVDQACARVIALRQPIASDLRMILSVMKIASNLERVADYAKNLAKRTNALVEMPPVGGTVVFIGKMCNEAHAMLSDALDAYIRQDEALAEQVRQRDLELDQMYNAIFRELLTFMMEDPRSITACMHLHFIAKNIERMGDHVTSVAEQVIYLVTGEMPDEDRPKATAVYGAE